MYIDDFFYCPSFMEEADFPSLNDKFRGYNNDNDRKVLDELDSFYNKYYLSDTRASEQDVNRIIRALQAQQPQLYTGFQGIIDNYFRTVISFTLDNSSNYTGNINQITNSIFNDFRRRYNRIFIELRSSGIPNGIINRIFRNVIEFTLRDSDSTPNPTPIPCTNWSQWEDRGGVLNTGL